MVESGPATSPSGAAGPAAPRIDRERLISDLRALVGIPSITGSEEAVAAWAAGALRESELAVETVTPDLAAIRSDPDWPGEEMERTSLPVVIGRAGRAGGRRIVLSGHLDVVPPGDPATWTLDHPHLLGRPAAGLQASRCPTCLSSSAAFWMAQMATR